MPDETQNLNTPPENQPLAQTEVNNLNPAPPSEINKPSKKSKKKYFIIIGIIIFAFILVSLLLLFFTKNQNKVSEEEITLLDKQTSTLEPKLISYPQVLTYSKDEKINLDKEWRNTVAEAENLSKKDSNNYNLEFDMGKLYLFGHNLDEEGSFEKSEEHFKNAIKLKPDSYEAHALLAYLYVNTSPKFAPLAENEYLEARKYANKNELPNILSGLFFAYYYQGKLQNAISVADEYLKYKPNDTTILLLKKTAESQIKNKN